MKPIFRVARRYVRPASGYRTIGRDFVSGHFRRCPVGLVTVWCGEMCRPKIQAHRLRLIMCAANVMALDDRFYDIGIDRIAVS